MNLINRLLIVLLLGCTATLHAQQQESAAMYPPVQPPKDPDALGRGIQRTMRLLATSTPENRNRVKILFYGQSITEQAWSYTVADDLRKRFPNADLEIENRAIGGFAAQWLIRPAEHDLYPFYPDLMIFYVSGDHHRYEDIIRAARSRTTAEVLMQNDHVRRWMPETIDKEKDAETWWADFMNGRFLPALAQKYGCGFLDQRSPWFDYLRANKYEPSKLLSDGAHLNDHGNWLMAQLANRYLVYRPELPPVAANEDAIKTVIVGKDAQWNGARLQVKFEGNRVDAIVGKDIPSSGISVRIDGKKPSEFPECYAITRPTPKPWSALSLTRVDHPAPLVLEEWKLTITSVVGRHFKFDVSGSVTGPDGNGSSDEVFTSRSQRVQIKPDAWFRAMNEYDAAKPVEGVSTGYEITWKVVPMFADRIPSALTGSVITLAQGLSNSSHELELSWPGVPPGTHSAIQSIRIYRPPVRDDEPLLGIEP